MNKAKRPVRKRRRRIVLVVAGLVILAVALSLRQPPLPTSETLAAEVRTKPADDLRSVASFNTIADADARSVAIFMEAGRVIQSPRCMNCHPRSDAPTQTDALTAHLPVVERGADGGGAPGLRCSTCHGAENFEASGVPGNPAWRLAPIEMAWHGKSLGEICRQIQDPRRGGLEAQQLLHHMAEDGLVGWAWNPGDDRAPPPGSQAEFGALIEAWLATGGRCPV